MKKAQLKTIMMIMFFIVVLAISSLAMSIKLTHPNNEWILTNSVSFNFTTDAEITSVPWCAIYSNRTGTMALTANYTDVPNGTPYIKGISFVDSMAIDSYNWSLTCYNGSDEISNKTGVYFGVDATTPSIVLDSPDDASYLKATDFNLEYTPTDESNLANCYLYHNSSGTFALNDTNTSLNTGYKDVVNFTFPADGTYKWNVYCNDTAKNAAWAESTNRTFTVDSTNPTDIKFIYPSNNTASSNATPLIKWNQSIDTNFDEYIVRVSNDTGFINVLQTITLTTSASNSTMLENLEKDGIYYVRVTAYDLAERSTNSTSDLSVVFDRDTPNATLNNPSGNNTYTNDNTPDFNVTVIDDNPDSCWLYLSNESGSSMSITKTYNGVVNNTEINLTNQTMADGIYQFNIGCNDTKGTTVNVSSSNYIITIDTVNPTYPNLTISWALTNNTDKIPMLTWLSSVETNFDRYFIQAAYTGNGTIAYDVNVSSRGTNYTTLNLSAGSMYNFTVTSYDLAGNSVVSPNTTDSWYYVDKICGTLSSGWNLCGAVWTSPKSLSKIGLETSATFVSVWNMSNHGWATCNYAVSSTGTNCNLNISIDSYYKKLNAPSGVTNVSGTIAGSTLAAATHFYRITAVSSKGEESFASSEVSVIIDGAAENASILSWDAVAGAGSYKVYNTTASENLSTYFITTNTSFNHTGQAVSGTGTPANISIYSTDYASTVWVYVNSSTEWRNRTWEALPTSMNITLSNYSNGWNIIAGIFRNGRTFGDLGRNFGQDNVSMFSLRYVNGTTVPYINYGNSTSFKAINNQTTFDYGSGMWVYYNGTTQTNSTWDVGSW